jgi:hypothetical protein
MRRIGISSIVAAFLVLASSMISSLSAFALDGKYDPAYFSANNIVLYNPDDSGCTSTNGVATGGPNKDYLGRDILNSAQLSAIQANESVYKQAADQAGIPWQMVAVIHLRESGLKKENPTNGQGIYQDAAKTNGPYPTGAVTDAEFLRQTIWAANFIKGKSSTPDSLKAGDEAAVKDAFYGYNGRAQAYADQAKTLGYSQAYEGSPYVMNLADAKRDPATNATGWGQIKTDGGTISYPANGDYGAYIVYASLAGLGTSECAVSGGCTAGGDIRANLVACAQQELALWQSGAMKPGFRAGDASSFSKYSYNVNQDWCADFISWNLKQVGHPIPGKNNVWPAVVTFLNNSSSLGYTVHKRGDGYKPQPGDFALYNGHEHMNMVVGYDSKGRMLTIGGNQTDHNNRVPEQKDVNVVSQNVGYGSSASYYIQVE